MLLNRYRNLNNVNFRIKKYSKGYVVEVEKRFLFFSYWQYIVSVTGFKNKPWFFSSREMAISETKRLLEWDLTMHSDD